MIKVRVVKKRNIYDSIFVVGHAMHDEYGKDIVCSAVSSIVTTSINGILLLKKDSLKYCVEEGNVTKHSICDDYYTQTLIQNMLNMLMELEKSYPENIQVK